MGLHDRHRAGRQVVVVRGQQQGDCAIRLVGQFSQQGLVAGPVDGCDQPGYGRLRLGCQHGQGVVVPGVSRGCRPTSCSCRCPGTMVVGAGHRGASERCGRSYVLLCRACRAAVLAQPFPVTPIPGEGLRSRSRRECVPMPPEYQIAPGAVPVSSPDLRFRGLILPSARAGRLPLHGPHDGRAGHGRGSLDAAIRAVVRSFSGRAR